MDIDFIKGVIYGGAIGDALGIATEFMNHHDIKKYYDGVEVYTYDIIIQDYHRSTWKKGDWTDDTDFTILAMKTFIENKNFNINKYARKMIDYINYGLPECDDTKGHGIGNTFNIWWGDMYSETDPLKAGLRSYIYNPYHQMFNESNGGIMKTAIISTFKYDNFDEVVKNTVNICAITHPSPLCVYTCIVINYIISKLLNTSDRSKNYIFNIILNVINDTKKYIKEYIDTINKNIHNILNENNNDDIMLNNIKEIINDKYEKFKERYTVQNLSYEVEYVLYFENLTLYDLQNNQGHTLKPLLCAVYSMRKALDGEKFENIISSIINQGGDSDTNCAVAGAVLGAFFGKSKLPQEYINGLKYKNVLDKYTDKYIQEVKCI